MQAVADQTQQLVASQMAFGASGLVGRTVSWTTSDGPRQDRAPSAESPSAPTVRCSTSADSQVALAQVQSVTGGTATSAAAPTSSTGTTGSTTV